MNEQTRIRLSELGGIAAELDFELTPRMRRDWTGLGFLAPATAEGRPGMSGGGVGRYWTPQQTDVFRAVLARYVERLPRYELANVPIAFWLLPFDGEQCVPLVQVRRTLTTFASAKWTRDRLARMVRRRIVADEAHGATPRPRARRARQAAATMPGDADREWLTRLLRVDAGADEDEIERTSSASDAALRGLAMFRELDDDVYRIARTRYRDDYLHALPPGVLADNACADLLTVLGRIATERGLGKR